MVDGRVFHKARAARLLLPVFDDNDFQYLSVKCSTYEVGVTHVIHVFTAISSFFVYSISLPVLLRFSKSLSTDEAKK